jgi:hypothetical protein
MSGYLSKDVLEECLSFLGDDGPTNGELPHLAAALRAHIAALEADNAALLEHGNRLYGLAQHDEACKILVGDDEAMCNCAMAEWQQAQRDSRPGAALLEEHRKALDTAIAKERAYRDVRIQEERARWVEEMRSQQREARKALVRARNEGLEKAAGLVEQDDWFAQATRIRALKEPEE